MSRKNGKSGVSIVYMVVAMSSMLMLASLAVDLGRVQVAKTELQRAADAAARAGAGALPNGFGSAQNAAMDIAAANLADGSPVILDPTYDFQVGHWDENTKSFIPLVGPFQGANVRAVKITARRVADRGNGIPCLFAKVLGRETCDVHASAVAVYSPRRFAAVGLEYIKLGGNATNSYKSTGNAPADHGDIASNGDITLGGSSLIAGNAFPGMGKMVIGANHVTGSTTPLSYTLNYPNGDAGIYKTSNNNGSVPSGAVAASSFKIGNQQTVTLQAGNYYFNNFNAGAGSILNIAGPVTIYVYGTLSLGGHVDVAGNLPKNLTIITVPNGGTAPGNITLNGTSALYADIYAPQSRINMSGTGDIYGSIVGRSIDMTGNSAIHYDMSLGGGIRLVQ